MADSEYIQIQNKAWNLVEQVYESDAEEDKPTIYEALKLLASLEVYAEVHNVLLCQQAKTLYGIAICLIYLDDSLDALKYLDELENLQPTFLTPKKDELKYYQKLGRELKREYFG